MITSIPSASASLSILPRLVAIVHLLFVLRLLVRLFVYHFIVHVPLAFHITLLFCSVCRRASHQFIEGPHPPFPLNGVSSFLAFERSSVSSPLVVFCLGLPRPSFRRLRPPRLDHYYAALS